MIPNTEYAEVSIVSEHKCVCGESPVWDDRDKALYWIDIPEGIIYRLSKDGELDYIKTAQKIGSIALTTSGRLIAALKNGLYSIDFPNKFIREIVDPEAGLPDNRLNDGKCDPEGRFWVGSMSDKGIPDSGALYTLEKNKVVTRKMDALTISNGMAWDLSRGKYYHIDTPTRIVKAYDYNSETGEIKNEKSVIEINDNEGVPDGMTIDEEGMLWIAHWNGSRVSRWNPQTSQKLEEIKLPVSKITSCSFGGEELNKLFITTAKIGLNEDDLLREPLAGATFVLKLNGIKGKPPDIVDDTAF